MSKRYQVFVSSTYTDLKDERSKVIQALMEMDCIPAGMELFPAADEDQFEFIKRVIADCDYYLLIVGGRYGSVTNEGISYTEKEYDFAISKGIRVIALLHADPDQLPLSKSERDLERSARLTRFTDKVKTGRLVKFWNVAAELPGLVALSLSKTIKTFPAIGWVRGDAVASVELLTELNDLRKAKAELEQTVALLRAEAKPQISNLAGLNEKVTLKGTRYSGNSRIPWKKSVEWKELFGLIAPHLIHSQADSQMDGRCAKVVRDAFDLGVTADIDDHTFQTIKVQFIALGLIAVQTLNTVGGGTGLFWSLTPSGKKLMLELRTIRSASEKRNPTDDES